MEGPDHNHNNTIHILYLKDTHSQSSAYWPREANHTKIPWHTVSTRPKTYDFMAVPPHCPHKCTPYFLYGWGNTTSSQPHQLDAFVAFPLAIPSTQSLWCGPPHLNFHGLTFNLLPYPRKHLPLTHTKQMYHSLIELSIH